MNYFNFEECLGRLLTKSNSGVFVIGGGAGFDCSAFSVCLLAGPLVNIFVLFWFAIPLRLSAGLLLLAVSFSFES